MESEGHRSEIEFGEGNGGEAIIRLRSRGHVVAIGTSERDPNYYSVSIAYELPEWARDQSLTAPLLADLQASFKVVKFFYLSHGTALIAAAELFCSTPEEFTIHLWRIVGILREAGGAALDRIVDSGESRAAAEKFINDFMRGQDS